MPLKRFLLCCCCNALACLVGSGEGSLMYSGQYMGETTKFSGDPTKKSLTCKLQSIKGE